VLLDGECEMIDPSGFVSIFNLNRLKEYRLAGIKTKQTKEGGILYIDIDVYLVEEDGEILIVNTDSKHLNLVMYSYHGF
jgi:hypothetical protein